MFSQADYDSDDSEWDEQQQRSKLSTGPMAQMEWYRVILDEAQLIRNRGTRMANAAFRLNAEYKWALTYVSASRRVRFRPALKTDSLSSSNSGTPGRFRGAKSTPFGDAC